MVRCRKPWVLFCTCSIWNNLCYIGEVLGYELGVAMSGLSGGYGNTWLMSGI